MGDETCDVLISGAGPAGSACALALRGSGLKVLLVDKSDFPRDKICGDAISVDVINQLPLLSQELAEAFESLQEKLEIPGIRIVAPGGRAVDIPFLYKGEPRPGYVCRRMDFDNLLFSHASGVPEGRFIQSTVTGATITAEEAIVDSTSGKIRARMVVAADGDRSVFSRLIGNALDKRQYSAGLRVYYKNVGGMHDGNFIELMFFRKLLPGYLWIFPLPGGYANVGLGVLSSVVSRKKLNLRKLLDELIHDHPDLEGRFAHAEPLERTRGFGLPLGFVGRKIAGERLLLTGDAAGLIDPFSGEGIGNAIRSGRKAADHVRRAFEVENFSASFNESYERDIYNAMGNEFRISRSLQQACRYPVLFNLIAKKASDPYWHQYLMESLTDLNKKSRLSDPFFYIKMLWK